MEVSICFNLKNCHPPNDYTRALIVATWPTVCVLVLAEGTGAGSGKKRQLLRGGASVQVVGVCLGENDWGFVQPVCVCRSLLDSNIWGTTAKCTDESGQEGRRKGLLWFSFTVFHFICEFRVGYLDNSFISEGGRGGATTVLSDFLCVVGTS